MCFISRTLCLHILITFFINRSIHALEEIDFAERIDYASITASSSSQQYERRLLFTLSDSPDDVRFFLFRNPRNVNQSKEILYNNRTSLQRSGFNYKFATVFLVHGYWSNSSSGMPYTLRKAYLDANYSLNIIVVDWGKLSTPNPKNQFNYPLSYSLVITRSLPIVYTRLAEFIQFLMENKYATLNRIHLIGHSLGAHVSGGAGDMVKSNNNGTALARISGLDPAGPFFEGIRLQRRLNQTDADFVDVYHTAAGTLGTVLRQQGHVDFFPNGGSSQPGCNSQLLFFGGDFGSCSHSFAYKIYVASISKNFTACQCDPEFSNNPVTGPRCPGNCQVKALVGQPCPPATRGQFYFNTTENP